MQESSLQEELRREIEREVEAVLARARRDVEEMVAAARRDVEERESAAREEVKAELEGRRRRAFARAELDGRTALLQLRREETDWVFREALEAVQRMAREEPERYLELLRHIFCACRRLLPPGPLRVRVGPPGEGVRERVVPENTVETIVQADLQGVILETADGRLHCDGSVEMLLKRLRQGHEAEIEEILFGADDGRQR